MKKLILMASLLAPVHALANSCNGNDKIAVRYKIWNESDYRISLEFGETAVHGDNPDSITVGSGNDPVEGYGCSNRRLRGYKTRATLTAYDYKRDSYFDLGYLYINNPLSGEGMFSFEQYGIKAPQCRCKVHVGKDWANMMPYDCAYYKRPMTERVDIRFYCK